MKKTIAVVSALILVLSVGFTACGKDNTFIDTNGNAHVAVNENGVTKQDEFGNLYEVIEKDGTTATQIFDFPAAMTNKAQTWIENGVLRMKVPHGWKPSGNPSKTTICHTGKCTELGTSSCQIEFKHETMLTVDEVMENYLGNARWLVERSGECSDLKEYDTELLGMKVKAVSYKFDKSGVTSYCYFLQKGIPVISIEIYTYKDCFTEDEIIELLNKNCKLKDLGGKVPETSASSEATSQSN